jgi:peptidoglycan/LPS O-acetylase OafA/YrhL
MTEADLREISSVPVAARVIRAVLALGSLMFVVSGLLLIIAPALMAEWLGLSTIVDTTWTLQMLGAALLGLSGQMWLVRRAPDHPVLGAAVVMIISGGLMTVLTITLPGEWTPVRWAYLGIGAAFCLAYVLMLVVSRRRG